MALCEPIFRIQTIFLLPCLAVAWDMAVITNVELQFLQDGNVLSGEYLKELVAGAYDPVRGDLYLSDTNQQNASVFRRNILGSTSQDSLAVRFQPIIAKHSNEIRGLAFDPVSSTLFWSTGYGRKIKKSSVNPDDKNELILSGDVIHEFEDELPLAITVDSCRQRIYWTNINHRKPSIERSYMNGTMRTVLISDNLFQPNGIVVDQQSKRIYWTNDDAGYTYRIEYSDLDGLNRKSAIQATNQQPFAIAVSSGYIYWTDSVYGGLWKLPKNVNGGTEPTLIKKFTRKPMGIMTNGDYLEVDEKECSALTPLKQKMIDNYKNHKISVSSLPQFADKLNPVQQVAVGCMNNGSMLSGGKCLCLKGFTGARCEMSNCHNYCVHGTCQFTEQGDARCSCQNGWSGDRCELSSSWNYCLNGGECSVNGTNMNCVCPNGFSGQRCEYHSAVISEYCRTYCAYDSKTTKYQSSTTGQTTSDSIASLAKVAMQLCRCADFVNAPAHETKSNPIHEELVGGFGEASTLNWVLGILSVSLFIAVIYLSSKVCSMRKRPHIRKRILVQKPFGNRPKPPDQCEITIENCCNMNICETPCFEPDFRTPKSTFSKSKREDKKNLISSSNTSLEDITS